MKKNILLIVIFLIIISCQNNKCNNTKMFPIENNYHESTELLKNTVSWNSEEGQKRLFNSEYKQSFFELASYYSPQQHAMECGIASARIVINALYKNASLQTPYHHSRSFGSDSRNFYLDYNLFTDEDIAIDAERKRIRGEGPKCDADIGIDIWNYPAFFKDKNLNAEYFNIENSLINKTIFIKTAKKILSTKNAFIVGFFNEHISPIVAYEQKSNSVLILDVEQHNTGWYWIDIDYLIKNILITKYHGYVTVSY